MNPPDKPTETKTLRDEFAMAAPFTLADAKEMLGDNCSILYNDNRAALLAVLSVLNYEYADQMIEQRLK